MKKGGMARGEVYEEFVEKFKPKKTTDDCITPPEIYNIVRDWACKEYGIDPMRIVRPFWPGGDYKRFDYPDGAVVLDNPPFSILAQICRFYLDRGIPFFLFAPGLTALGSSSIVMRINHIICGVTLTYGNGAKVQTSFATSFGGDVVMQTAPELTKLLRAEMEKKNRKKVKTIPRYEYPDNVATPAMMGKYGAYGVDWKIRRGDCKYIEKLDGQRLKGKKIFGGGLLLSDRAVAERKAAQKSAERKVAQELTVHKWELSDREREIVAALTRGDRIENAERMEQLSFTELEGF